MFNLYWNIVELRCFHFRCIAKWFSYTNIYIYVYVCVCIYIYIYIYVYVYIYVCVYIYILFQILFPFRLL